MVTVRCVFLFLLFTGPAFAWNSLGHKVVAEIAWEQLTPTQRQQIVEILRRHPRFQTDFIEKMEDDAASGSKEVQDHWIFQHAATWPDQIRKKKEYDRPSWHYINMPLYLDRGDRVVLDIKAAANILAAPGRTRRDQYNVLQALAANEAIIKSKADAGTKAIAYCWVLHLVGDIHQPLHSTALFSVNQFPKGDEGGNKILLVRGKNLHALWDGLLGRQYYMRNVDKAVRELHDNELYKRTWETAAKETDPRKWAEESHDQCISFVYSDAIRDAVRATPHGEKMTPIGLPDDYYRTAGEVARERIVKAGVRLGALLQSLSK